MKLYAMDADCQPLENWPSARTEHEATSAEALARSLAIKWIDDAGEIYDGALANVLVATRADGSDAVRYTVRLDIQHHYDIKSESDVGEALRKAVAASEDYRASEEGCS